MGSVGYIVIIAAMFLWIMYNNKKSRKQEAEMQKKLKPGMYVMLRDGLFGTIVDVQEKEVVINFSVDGADEGCLTVGKDSIYSIIEQTAGEAKNISETKEVEELNNSTESTQTENENIATDEEVHE